MVTLEVPPDEPWIETLPLRVQQRITRLDTNRIEVNLPVGVGGRVEIPAALQKFPVLAERDSESGVTWALGPMALRSEGSRRNQYVLLNVEGRGEVDVVREADARLREAIRSGEIELPPGSNFRWVGRYEQKIRADQTMRWVIGLSAVIMIGLIYAGTRSALVTAVIVGCNAVVATAGGFLFVWWWDAQMTTAVAVGFLVLLGVMFNDGILLSTYLHERFRDPPDTIEEVRRRVLKAGLRRRRPALMTNLTTLLGLTPILWAEGRGAELMQPMVLPVLGGMIFDLAGLFSVPVVYAWYWEWKLRRRQKAGQSELSLGTP